MNWNASPKGRPLSRPDFGELQRVIHDWKLPAATFHDLLDAFAQDVQQKRYADYAELLDYCRRSANPVGRLLLHLVDRTSAENLYCVPTVSARHCNSSTSGKTSPLTGRNSASICRMSWRNSILMRRRLPPDAGMPTWAALLDFQINRTRALMREGAPLVHQLPGRMGWEIRFTVQGGLRILERIRQVRE